jgi:hypothetical protein
MAEWNFPDLFMLYFKISDTFCAPMHIQEFLRRLLIYERFAKCEKPEDEYDWNHHHTLRLGAT